MFKTDYLVVPLLTVILLFGACLQPICAEIHIEVIWIVGPWVAPSDGVPVRDHTDRFP